MPDDITPADAPTVPLTLRTADGLALEAERRTPPDPRGTVVLAHPHPAQGGSMRSLVTSELFRGLPDLGLDVLRFNFRGVEGSEGEHGGGTAEHADIVAAIDAVADDAAGAGRPLVLAGWSFGADVSLSVLDDRLAGWFLIAAPLRVIRVDAMVVSSDPRPKRFAIPENDQFRQPDAVASMTRDWVNTTVETVKGGDHFLVGRTAIVATWLAEFVASLA